MAGTAGEEENGVGGVVLFKRGQQDDVERDLATGVGVAIFEDVEFAAVGVGGAVGGFAWLEIDRRWS